MTAGDSGRRLRVIVTGQSDFASFTIRTLIDRGHDVVQFVCTKQQSDLVDISEQTARELGIESLRPSRLDGALAEQLYRLNADIGLMAYVTIRATDEYLSLPRLGTIQFHPSLLPKYRGPSAVNWAIIKGERMTGITIFQPNAVFDDGQVLLQETILIEENETAGGLYRKHLMPIGVQSLVGCAERLKAGTIRAYSQDRSQATYQGWCSDDHARIEWSSRASDIHNLIRGCDPRPGSWTMSSGERLAVCRSRPIYEVPEIDLHEPGTIIEVQHDGVIVACGSGYLEIVEVRDAAGRRIPISDLVSRGRFSIGQRLG